MEKVYLIVLFNKKTRKYLTTFREVYLTKELAQIEIDKFDNPCLIFSIVQVDLIKSIDYIY